MIVYYCLAIAMLIPIILALSSIPFRVKQLSAVNLNEPRAQAEQLAGAGARLVAAQKNAWEGLILFAVSIFIADANGVNPDELATAGLVFITARIGHAIFYVAGLGVLRFITFIIAIGAVGSIVSLGLLAS